MFGWDSHFFWERERKRERKRERERERKRRMSNLSSNVSFNGDDFDVHQKRKIEGKKEAPVDGVNPLGVLGLGFLGGGNQGSGSQMSGLFFLFFFFFLFFHFVFFIVLVLNVPDFFFLLAPMTSRIILPPPGDDIEIETLTLSKVSSLSPSLLFFFVICV